MAIVTIQAPWVNFAWITSSAHEPVVAAPTPLIALADANPAPSRAASAAPSLPATA